MPISVGDDFEPITYNVLKQWLSKKCGIKWSLNLLHIMYWNSNPNFLNLAILLEPITYNVLKHKTNIGKFSFVSSWTYYI